jgi:hypothetical protein
MRWIFLAVCVFAVVFAIQAKYDPHITGKAGHVHFPMRELGVECDRIWSDGFGDLPCPYTTGHWFYAGNAAHAMKDRPSVHFYYYDQGSPEARPTGTWSTDKDVNQRGGIILWEASTEVPDWVHHRFPKAEVLPKMLELPYKTGATISPVRIGVAIVPPQKIP